MLLWQQHVWQIARALAAMALLATRAIAFLRKTPKCLQQ
jgi:hypothetical protein